MGGASGAWQRQTHFEYEINVCELGCVCADFGTQLEEQGYCMMTEDGCSNVSIGTLSVG